MHPAQTTVILSSVRDEYYLKVFQRTFPGTLQYSVDIDELMNVELPNNSSDCGFRICEHSVENLRRVVTLSIRNIDWEILLMTKKET